MRRLIYLVLCVLFLTGCTASIAPADDVIAYNPTIAEPSEMFVPSAEPSAVPSLSSPLLPPSPLLSPSLVSTPIPTPEPSPSPELSPSPEPDPTPDPSPIPQPTPAPTPSPEAPPPAGAVYAAEGSHAPPPAGTIVWRASKTTKVYHSVSTCSNMKSPYELSIEDATSLDLRPCKKCWSGVD